jgi:polypeptide N-acetylgalactosaminyltransferase
LEAPRSGPGEGGKPHVLLPDQRNEASQSISEFGMNMVVSDEISLSRTISDTRTPE